MKSNINNDGSVLVSIKGLSKLLSVPKSTIYHWVHTKKIPHFKAGKHLRFDVNQVMKHFKYQDSCSLKTEDEGDLNSKKKE